MKKLNKIIIILFGLWLNQTNSIIVEELLEKKFLTQQEIDDLSGTYGELESLKKKLNPKSNLSKEIVKLQDQIHKKILPEQRDDFVKGFMQAAGLIQ